ncbi:acyl-CoA dehydrogenase [Sphingomonas sp. Leaf4]|uniref:acyl-CoA dehydrogenase n=1 Tax=Sphingomonas sp. Leaf4 TaxID=2876553 RepID=UPI001E450390|nr:acyl-CoA dehydrogenase [Sphingomonas sp. Leaf4]
MTPLAAIRAIDPALPPRNWMVAAFAIARAAGLDDATCATPGEARALMRRMAAAGRADVAFGRILDGHVNAVQLVRRYAPAFAIDALLANGAILGVWNSDLPGDGLRHEGGTFTGAKNFASGAGFVTHSIVTTHANDPMATRMWLLDMAAAEPAIDRDWWHPIGMVRSETHIVHLDGVPLAAAQAIGGPGDYQRQPDFSAGALRFVAVQAGAVHALFDHVRDHLNTGDRAAHPQQAHRLARLFVLADAGYALIDGVAAHWTGDEDVLLPRVAAARGALEDIATEAMALAQSAVGVQGMLRTHPLARTLTDLTVYLRQPNPDGARSQTGAAAAAGRIVPGA